MALAGIALELMATAPLLIALTASIVRGWLLQVPGLVADAFAVQGFMPLALPSLADFKLAAAQLVLPQLALTFSNAILLTALLAGDYFGERAAHVTSARLSISTGLANLLFTPFGALPMCHGAGGLAAHHRFGARSGTAPLLLGLALGAFALLPLGFSFAILGPDCRRHCRDGAQDVAALFSAAFCISQPNGWLGQIVAVSIGCSGEKL